MSFGFYFKYYKILLWCLFILGPAPPRGGLLGDRPGPPNPAQFERNRGPGFMDRGETLSTFVLNIRIGSAKRMNIL